MTATLPTTQSPLDNITYEDLYRRWENGNWKATAIDFSKDAEQWQTEFTEFEHNITYHTMLHDQFDRFFGGFRRDAHPMAIMVGAVGAQAVPAVAPLSSHLFIVSISAGVSAGMLAGGIRLLSVALMRSFADCAIVICGVVVLDFAKSDDVMRDIGAPNIGVAA